jgi:hypothetical protein
VATVNLNEFLKQTFGKERLICQCYEFSEMIDVDWKKLTEADGIPIGQLVSLLSGDTC